MDIFSKVKKKAIFFIAYLFLFLFFCFGDVLDPMDLLFYYLILYARYKIVIYY